MASKLRTFLSELKRRKVYHVGVAYVVVGWGVSQGAEYLFGDLLKLPPVVWQAVAGLVLLGFPIALVLAWAYEVRPEQPEKEEAASEIGPETPPSEPPGSIAVLPFANMSDDSEAEYFSDGMTEEIINALAQLEGLRVAARTSSFSFKGKTPEIAEVGSKLNVATVLEGSVRKDGSLLRITAQLVSVADGFHLWSERYDRQMEDVFAIQDDIARAIAEKLRVTLAGGADEPLVRPPTDSLEAYDLYLKGRFFVTQGGEGSRLGLDLFRQALARDPRYALALAGIAEAYSWLGGTGVVRPKDALPKAQEAARQALELDDTLAEAHVEMGNLAWSLDSDWSSAEGHFLRALELNGSLPHLRSLYGFFLASIGRVDESLSEMERGIQLDPLSQVAHIWLGQVLAWLGRLEESIEHLRKALQLDPSSWNANHILGMAHRLEGDYSKAIEAIKKGIALAGRHPWSLMELALAYSATDNDAQAEAIYDELEARGRGEYVPPAALSFVSAALGRRDQAFEWLEKALEEHDSLMTWIALLPHFDPLRDDPRFPVLVEKMGLTLAANSYRSPSVE